MGLQSSVGRPSRRQYHLIAAVTACLFLIFFFLPAPSAYNSIASKVEYSTPKHKYAYCSLLAPSTQGTGQANNSELAGEDHYMVGTRMLIYQLLHDPTTRTTSNIPYIVLVTHDVPQLDRERLSRDGATVVEVSPIKIDWIKPGNQRWAQVMDKLHVFELIQYEKILLLDSDHVIVRPLDGVFDDPATEVRQNLGNQDKIKDDEAVQPSEYIMAGNSGPTENDHPYPAPRGNRLNAGFVVLQPSIAMFNHYMSVAAIEDRFPGHSPEQDLWNYVHHRHGNMPWKQVNPDWTANTPSYNDYEHGIASFHEKYWGCKRDQKLRDVLLKSRWKMEGFFDARDKSS